MNMFAAYFKKVRFIKALDTDGMPWALCQADAATFTCLPNNLRVNIDDNCTVWTDSVAGKATYTCTCIYLSGIFRFDVVYIKQLKVGNCSA